MRLLLVLFAIVLTTPGVAASQDIDNLYLPYAFRLPFLDSGEYVITANYSDNSSRVRVDVDPFTSIDAEAQNRFIRFGGAVALSKFLLVEAGITVTPSQTVVMRNSGFNDSVDMHLDPLMSVVVRPIERLEISGSLIYSDFTLSREGREDTITTRNYDIGLTYFGKF